jgi:hypothetical protein
MLENRFIEQDKVAFVTGAYPMSIRDYVVRADSTDGAFSLTLPPVTEAMGRIYAIHLSVWGGDVTIQDHDDSEDWTDMIMGVDNDGAVLYSDGRKWWILHKTITV